MAVTNFGVNSPQAMKLWEKVLARETLKATPIFPLLGNKSDSIIQVFDEFKKQSGDAITYSLRAQLSGAGVSEHNTLEGNEERMQFLSGQLRLNELAHAVRVRADDTASAQRVPFNTRDEAKTSLADWYSQRLATTFFLHVCGYTANTITIAGVTSPLSPVYWGFNDPKAPSANRWIIQNGKKDEKSLTPDDKFTLSSIDMAVEKAKVANPRLRPVQVGTDRVYVLYLHPYQVTALRTNTNTGQWLDIQKAAYNGSRAKNPIFDGSLGMYNGVVLRESEDVTPGVDGNKSINTVRRAVLLGAQSAVMGWGKNINGNKYRMVEEFFDYSRELGVAVKTVFGCTKTRYTPEGSDSGEDFGTIVISTYAAASA